ncbi:MAG: hypothetical protein JWP12_1198 [Bacteroidetes bacterium]|nr:hypothetical protein [Bacteroidota bacterium]
MKKYNLLFLLLIITCSVFAQKPDSTKQKVDSIQVKINKLVSTKDSIKAADTIRYWKKGGMIGINFAQSSFTNWAAGGENAISATGLVNLFANYKRDKTTWDNNLDLAYGLLQSGTEGIRKNEDKIDFSSKFGHYAFLDHWYYTALLNFKSQFDNGYNYPDDSTIISHFLAPGYVLGALGLDYKTKDNSFSFFVSPITSKTTIVNDQRLANEGAYGVDKAEYDSVGGAYVVVKKGKLVRNEFGGYVKIAYKKDIIKNVSLATKLELFTNYLENPQNIDVNWELLLAMKVNRFITASVSTQMIYDDDIPVPVERTDAAGVKYMGTGPRLQFKEVIAVGISYKF